MKYDLSIASEQVVNDLNKKTKRWLIKHAMWLNLRHKQAVTDHAMEMNSLREQLETEKKSADFWRAEANKAAATDSKTQVELRQSRSFVTKQEQVIRELGGAVSKLGECIAHL